MNIQKYWIKTISNNLETVIKILHLKGKRSRKIQNLMINWEHSQRKWKISCGAYEKHRGENKIHQDRN